MGRAVTRGAPGPPGAPAPPRGGGGARPAGGGRGVAGGYGFTGKRAEPPGYRDRARKQRLARAKAAEAVGT